ncbi:hypothetical protein A3C26_02600 [Candidatus Daviesbacteria bacterium RIFCSPHIGHO2_02_FULL_39_12]|uniref:Aspartyl/glutamyl-tRNA(Asn/Gln) amidotransferase subunit C n=2 Tax=Candidatus Daviesiibacteriota TaxID=1752718 RepID=A0A1F5JDK5_9BACT|nr:MAG: hypothetical protein A3C26_02600 [Candidatus Daviesbacteria bacterium RIFCSPHIGHO2_02_FULL_39_12]OGE71545.1 MAG: hypothetical protein A3H40_00730 [Candidatus Daviesbacteria bacterium RIFCSPLOWO2_02_FULL_38_15]
MSLTKNQVKHVAKLANLTLSEEEISKLGQQLSETLKFIEQLEKVDTSKVEMTSQVTGLSNIVRTDDTIPSLTQDQALQNAHSQKDGFFKVKAVFGE